MADLDAELLALAGGDSSGEESLPSPPARKSPSPIRAQKSSTDMVRGLKGVATKVKKSKRRRDYSDDEDEVASISAHSESASMSQSPSEPEFAASDDGDLEEDGPLFPYQKLYYDAGDKAKIEAMNEIGREEILAQRQEQVERHDQDNQLKRMMASRKKEPQLSSDKKKRKADAAELEESQRKSSRRRTKLGGGRAGEQSSAIAAYKQQRAEKNLRDERRKSGGPARRASPEDDFSEDDADGESDEFDDRRYKRRSPSPTKDDLTADLADVQHARIGRDNFAQVCETPGFERAVDNCFVRICLGPGRTPGTNEYRLCSIKGFQTGRPYAMTDTAGRPFLVDRYVIAAHGKAEKPWSFLECSMSRFTDDEWRRYRLTMANEDCKMPTKGFVAKKLEQIGTLINHRWGDKQVDRKMVNRRALLDKVNRTEEKMQVRDALTEARRVDNRQLIEELEEKLANIVPMKLALNTTLGKQEKKEEENRDAARLGDLNRRYQQLNAENIRKAQLAEMHKRKAKKHLAPGVDELFEGGSDISRTGTPVNGHSTPKVGATISRAGTPNPLMLANGTPRAGTPVSNILRPVPRAGTPLSNLGTSAAEKKKGLPVIRKAAMDDEILASMDLGIDIDF